MEEIKRVCCKCKIEKLIGEFTANNTKRYGKGYKCKPCANIDVKAKYKPKGVEIIEPIKGEIWKDIAGYSGKYKISSFGRLISVNGKYKGERLLKPCLAKKEGYYITCLRINGGKEYYRIHRLVAVMFLENNNNLPSVNHKDGNKINNHVSNLEWVTTGENTSHAFRTGLADFKGEKSVNSKLKESDVLLIRDLSNTGLSSSEIASKLNHIVSRRHVTDIINRVNWKHI